MEKQATTEPERGWANIELRFIGETTDRTVGHVLERTGIRGWTIQLHRQNPEWVGDVRLTSVAAEGEDGESGVSYMVLDDDANPTEVREFVAYEDIVSLGVY